MLLKSGYFLQTTCRLTEIALSGPTKTSAEIWQTVSAKSEAGSSVVPLKQVARTFLYCDLNM